MMLRRPLLALARSRRLGRMAAGMPVTSGIVSRFVAGESIEAAVAVVERLHAGGLTVTLDHLGEDTRDRAAAEANRDAYLTLLARLADAGLTPAAEVSVKLSAIGQALPGDGPALATDNAAAICAAAEAAATTVTLDMEDHTTTDATLGTVHQLRVHFPWVAAVLQAYLRRTEGDCRDLAGAGSRVRLCKGAYDEPASVAFTSRADVDRSYVRCLRILMSGEGYPMVATHDPRLVEIAGTLALANGRAPGSYEFQMLYGVRPAEQARLVAAGETVRVYVPYGDQWFGYLARRLAERPANLGFALRSIMTRS